MWRSNWGLSMNFANKMFLEFSKGPESQHSTEMKLFYVSAWQRVLIKSFLWINIGLKRTTKMFRLIFSRDKILQHQKLELVLRVHKKANISCEVCNGNEKLQLKFQRNKSQILQNFYIQKLNILTTRNVESFTEQIHTWNKWEHWAERKMN